MQEQRRETDSYKESRKTGFGAQDEFWGVADDSGKRRVLDP